MSNRKTKRLVMIVAGGTGGHLYPGIAVGRALRQLPEAPDVLFAVRRGDLGRAVLEQEGFPIIELRGQGMPRTLNRKALLFPFAFLSGFVESRRALRLQAPDVVLGMGGYLSFSVLLHAHTLGIPTMIHEQNVWPGLTNRLLARWVTSVAMSFPGSQKYFPKSKSWVSGLPVRAEIGSLSRDAGLAAFGLDPGKRTFLVFGGSQGAHRLNQGMIEAWKKMASVSDGFQVLHVTGEKDFADFQAIYKTLPMTSVVIPYCHRMPEAYAAADLVICRSGASTVAELLAAQRPSMLIPFPFASDNHQWYNADFLAHRGVAEIILEKDFDSTHVAYELSSYVTQADRLRVLAATFQAMTDVHQGRDAADLIARRLKDFSDSNR